MKSSATYWTWSSSCGIGMMLFIMNPVCMVFMSVRKNPKREQTGQCSDAILKIWFTAIPIYQIIHDLDYLPLSFEYSVKITTWSPNKNTIPSIDSKGPKRLSSKCPMKARLTDFWPQTCFWLISYTQHQLGTPAEPRIQMDFQKSDISLFILSFREH